MFIRIYRYWPAETIQSETQQETQEDGESAQEEPQEPEASENPEADSAGDKTDSQPEQSETGTSQGGQIRISRSKSRMISHRPDKRKNLLKRKRQRMIQQYRKINRRKMRTQHLWCRML